MGNLLFPSLALFGLLVIMFALVKGIRPKILNSSARPQGAALREIREILARVGKEDQKP